MVTKKPKRPRDTISNAIHVAKLATGEIEEAVEDDGKDPAAKSLGQRGGKARAQKLSAKKRSEIAKKAAKKRWEKQ